MVQMTHTPRAAMPGPSPETEALKRAELRKHKAIATGLLILATAIYITMRWIEYRAATGAAAGSAGDAAAWVGYIRAAAEAGMVGALADWFAVTALFRHPLRIPIPHTAIIKRKKDQVGEQLAGFVADNFLNAPVVTEKLRTAQIPERLSAMMVRPDNAERVSAEAGKLIHRILNDIDPEDAETLLSHLVIDKLGNTTWAPLLGRGLEQLMSESRTEPVVDAVVIWLDEKAHTSEDFVVRLIDERTPAWAPRFVRELVGDKVYRELVAFTTDVRHNPQHEARQQISRLIEQFAQDLQHDPAMIARVEGFKQDIMSSGPVRALPGQLWEFIRATLSEQASDSSSLLRGKIREAVLEWGTKLQRNPQLRQKLDSWIVRGAVYLADNYAGEITGVISDTIESWDAEEASERIELMVGKDLQFIRVNGTVVGALAGVTIYALTELAFIVL